MSRILATAALVVLAMALVKDGRVLHRVGLTGSCRSVAAAADGTTWQACRPGRLEGRPDLTRDSCTSAGLRGRVEYWRCPAPLATAMGAAR
ncbi:MAG TPA: hypothetical protein VGF23_24255 [Gaiellaceae bacterium]|jgi:hypothetical protein